MGLFSRLFPRAALKRALARQALETIEQRRFNTHSTYRPSWTMAESADSTIQAGLADLRARSRHLAENHDLYAGVLDELVNQVVGTGLQVEPMGTSTTGRRLERFNEQAARVWSQWTEHPEATGELNWFEAQRKICWMWFADGEVFIRDVTSSAYPWMANQLRYTFEVLESDYVPHEFVGDNQLTATRHALGIAHDRWNRPTAFYFFKSHPGDRISLMTVSVQDLDRVPAEQVTHLKFTRRWPQTRGQPIAHATFDRIADIFQYEEYERIAAKVGASMTAFIQKDIELAGGTAGAYGDDAQRTLQMAGGMIYELLPGESVSTADTNRPNPELTNFRASQVRAVAAGAGTKYSTIARQYDSSYSAARQEMVEAEVGYMKLRDYFVERFIRRIYRRVIETAIMQRQIELPRTATLDTATRIEVNGPGLPWIDPKKEVEADILAVNNNFTSRSAVIRKRGQDPRKVSMQIEQDEQNEQLQSQSRPGDTVPEGDDQAARPGQEDGDSDGEQRDARITAIRA